MKKIIIFLLAACAINAQTYEEYKTHFVFEEGIRYEAYNDAGGKSIGIGHFIQPHEDFTRLSDEEVDALFQIDLRKAISDTKTLIPNFEKHNKEIRIHLVSMCFNLGTNGFFNFKKFRKAMINMDYNAAIVEIINSKWYKQVPNRAKRVISALHKSKRAF